MALITAELMDGQEKRDTRGRRIAARERRAELLAGLAASGLTVRAFARREGINANTLSKWVWLSRRTAPVRPVRFAELSVSRAPAWLFEVQLPDGRLVRAASAAAMAELLQLVRA
jgi:transposase-like protein